ncbi:MAG: HAMP domain-containing histidine kinase [Pseudomonadales bacterium]|nr:HAMP domain-containing histidine kinase [Pseudomonadales bacterium]
MAKEATNTRFLVTYWESDPALPTSYSKLSSGIFDLKDQTSHLLVAKVPQVNERLFIVFNEEDLSDLEAYEIFLGSGLVILAFLMLLIAGGVASALIAKKLAYPLEKLVSQLQQGWKFGEPLSGSTRQDEIGELSKGLESYAGRLQEVLEREKAFTRHASHEMRTPIGVIKNSLAVINIPDISQEKREISLKRISNACKDLEQLTNVFLMLGRPSPSITSTAINIHDLIEATLGRINHLIEQQQLTIVIQGDKSKSVLTHHDLFKVLMTNLILNAIDHGNGSLNVRYDERQIEVENLIPENKAHAPERHNQENHGYGLEIVERIANTLGWQFQCQNQASLFSAKVTFIPD